MGRGRKLEPGTVAPSQPRDVPVALVSPHSTATSRVNTEPGWEHPPAKLGSAPAVPVYLGTAVPRGSAQVSLEQPVPHGGVN